MTGGRMGACPDWYPEVKASRYLPSVQPWEWQQVGRMWLDRVLIAQAAETEAARGPDVKVLGNDGRRQAHR